MSEINNSSGLTTIPPETAQASPKRNDLAQEKRQQRRKLDRTRKLQRNNCHAFLQYNNPGMTPEICQSLSLCKGRERFITSRYRVCLSSTRRRHFHPECFEQTYDVTLLMPTHFKMEDPALCGLMVHKWFQYNRLVDLDAIAEYMMRDSCYRLGMLEPGESMPELNGYATGLRRRCSLKDLVDNIMSRCFCMKALALAV